MRYFFVFFLLLIGLTIACGGSDGGDVPTLIPTADVSIPAGDSPDNSPRITESPANNLPATWTPQPQPSPLPLTTVSSSPDPAGTVESYTVQAGDTLAEIAARYGVDLNALAEANNIENIDVIEVGQVLIIPR